MSDNYLIVDHFADKSYAEGSDTKWVLAPFTHPFYRNGEEFGAFFVLRHTEYIDWKVALCKWFVASSCNRIPKTCTARLIPNIRPPMPPVHVIF